MTQLIKVKRINKSQALREIIKDISGKFTSNELKTLADTKDLDFVITKKNVLVYLWQAVQDNKIRIVDEHKIDYRIAVYRRIKNFNIDTKANKFILINNAIKKIKGPVNCAELKKQLKIMYPDVYIYDSYIYKRLKNYAINKTDPVQKTAQCSYLKDVINKFDGDFTIDIIKERLDKEYPSHKMSKDSLIIWMAEFVKRGFVDRVKGHRLNHIETTYEKTESFSVEGKTVKKDIKKINVPVEEVEKSIVSSVVNKDLIDQAVTNAKVLIEKKDFKVRSLADNGTWRSYAVDSFKDAVLRYIDDTNQIVHGTSLMIVKDQFDFAKVFKLAVSYDIKEIE